MPYKGDSLALSSAGNATLLVQAPTPPTGPPPTRKMNRRLSQKTLQRAQHVSPISIPPQRSFRAPDNWAHTNSVSCSTAPFLSRQGSQGSTEGSRAPQNSAGVGGCSQSAHGHVGQGMADCACIGHQHKVGLIVGVASAMRLRQIQCMLSVHPGP